MVLRIIQDIRHKVMSDPLKIILPIVVVIVLVVRERINLRYLTEIGFEGRPSAGDLYVSLFWGIESLLPGEGLVYLPYEWLILMVSFSYASADLISKELADNNYIKILKAGRNKWIIDKYIVGIFMVIILFLLFILVCILSAAWNKGSIEVGITEYTKQLRNVYIEKKYVLNIYLIPLTAMITLCVLQITVELASNSIISFLFIIGIDIFSCFYSKVYLPGNGTMLVRGILGENRIHSIPFVIICILLCITAIQIGRTVFSRKDLLCKL